MPRHGIEWRLLFLFLLLFFLITEGFGQRGEKNRLLMMIDYADEWVYQIESRVLNNNLLLFFFFSPFRDAE